MSDDQSKPDTRLVQAGRRHKDWLHGLVNVPLERTSTMLFDSVAEMEAAYPPRDGSPSYGRNGTRTHWALAEALTELEPGAAGTKLFPSGAGAVAMALLSVLRTGDELLMVDSAYEPTRSFCDNVLKNNGISTVYYDPLSSPEQIDALITDGTAAIFLESPGSLTFEVQDILGICAVAKRHGIATLLDNTWSTPLFFPALSKGVDLTILACTKYIGGHSDVMLGSVTCGPAHWDALGKTYRNYGQSVGADEAYLAARGLRTLGVRLRQHERSAMEIATWLKQHPQVALVLHPAFEDCPGHQFFQRDFLGSSGLFSFVLKHGGRAEASRVVDALEHFGIGYSWGGFESLAIPASPRRSLDSPYKDRALIRLQVGLEDPADLIEDLDKALRATG